MAVAGLCAFDKKGKMVYFDELPNDYDFFEGMTLKLLTPTLTIKTENWGYFQTAYEKVRDNSSSTWKDYDCYYALLATAGVTGLMWILLCSCEAHAFRKGIWTSATKVYTWS